MGQQKGPASSSIKILQSNLERTAGGQRLMINAAKPYISFNNEDVKFTLKQRMLLKKWIAITIKSKNRNVGEIAFVFCSDEYLLTINKQYLKHDTLTDIITFDYSKEDFKMPVSGDIFISIERVKENAIRFSKSFEEELHRVIIHGILHLLGYKDKTKMAKEKMTEQENVCLLVLKKL